MPLNSTKFQCFSMTPCMRYNSSHSKYVKRFGSLLLSQTATDNYYNLKGTAQYLRKCAYLLFLPRVR